MKTAIELHNEVVKTATENQELRFVKVMKVGQFAHQGDIYLVRCEKPKELGKRLKTLQLAEGATKGSRHILSDFAGECYAPVGGTALDGPVVIAPERFTLTHPEHAHYSLPKGCYAVRFQRDFEQEEIARVRD